MAKFNWKSINSKIKAATSSKSVTARSAADISAAASNAADDFIGAINNAISSAGFSGGQQGAVSSWSHGEPSVNASDGTATITISGTAPGISLYSRESVDLVDVFSRGHTPSTYVYGEWNGEYIRSSRSLTYHDFVEDAINSFQGRAGNGYTVINITRS